MAGPPTPPQQTLYVPAPLLRAGRNEVLLLDLERRPTLFALAESHHFGRAAHAHPTTEES